MNNLELCSRAIDQKIIVVAGAVGCWLLAGVVGLALPAPDSVPGFRLMDGFLVAMLLVLVWAGFRLLRPRRYRRRWVVAEPVVVLLVWGLFVVALGFWVGQLTNTIEEIESMKYEVRHIG